MKFAVALARICKAILNDEKATLPLSIYLSGQYQQNDIFIGVSSVVGKTGIENTIEIPLNDPEFEKMFLSTNKLLQVIQKIFSQTDT